MWEAKNWDKIANLTEKKRYVKDDDQKPAVGLFIQIVKRHSSINGKIVQISSLNETCTGGARVAAKDIPDSTDPVCFCRKEYIIMREEIYWE